MPYKYIDTNSIGTGTRIDLLAIYDCFVAAGVRVVSTDINGIVGSGVNTLVTVAGEVTAQYFGIRLTGGVGDHVTIQAGGAVSSMASTFYNAALWVESDNAVVVNHGSLSGMAHGVWIEGDDTLFVNHGSVTAYGEDNDFGAVQMLSDNNLVDTKAWFINYGSVVSNRTAYGGDADFTDQVENYGTITGRVEMGGGDDFLFNRGLLNGDVFMGDGDDSMDNGHGAMVSIISLGAGNDTLYCNGTEAEYASGGDGIDTLDFRYTGAVALALDFSFDPEGGALTDTLLRFENIGGSQQNDFLRGDELANLLVGRGGKDTIQGGLGADTLRGAMGEDVLTGGRGNDIFRFTRPGEGGDTITDFRNVSGNNDRFMVSAAEFGGGLVAGDLAGGRFLQRADNHAQDANDRFIYRTGDHTVWFDVDGRGGEGPVLLAHLQAGATVSAADFLIY